MMGYDGWKLASPYDDENEWEETIEPTCETELDREPDGHNCNDNCEASEGFHLCGWNGKVTADCSGSDDEYTQYWTCPECGTENEQKVG
jgi:hypothetical protein